MVWHTESPATYPSQSSHIIAPMPSGSTCTDPLVVSRTDKSISFLLLNLCSPDTSCLEFNPSSHQPDNGSLLSTCRLMDHFLLEWCPEPLSPPHIVEQCILCAWPLWFCSCPITALTLHQNGRPSCLLPILDRCGWDYALSMSVFPAGSTLIGTYWCTINTGWMNEWMTIPLHFLCGLDTIR